MTAFGRATYGSTSYAGGDGAGGLVYYASGFKPTRFGTPRGPLPATGFKPTRFGTPRLFPYHAVGFKAAKFGTVTAQQYWRAASLGNVARIPRAYTKFNQAPVVSGFAPAHIGVPFAWQTAPGPIGQIVSASGLMPTRLGTPRVAYARIGAASGFEVTTFGTPRVVSVRMPSGWLARTFGVPIVRLHQLASGFGATRFGTPRSLTLHQATGFKARVSFGLPEIYRPNTYLAYGINLTGRLGHPTAFIRFNHPASGFNPVRLGTPAAAQRHLVTAIPPIARFGTPLIRRGEQC